MSAHALAALCAIARLHQTPADPATLAHQLGLSPTDAPQPDDLLRAAKHLGLKAKLSRTTIERLALTPLPALALMRGADDSMRVVILAQCDGKRVLFQDFGNLGSDPNLPAAQAALPAAQATSAAPPSSLLKSSPNTAPARSSSSPAAPPWLANWPSSTSPGSSPPWSNTASCWAKCC